MPDVSKDTQKQPDRADNRISINVKFIALNIGKREIRLTADEALQLRNELTKLLDSTSAKG